MPTEPPRDWVHAALVESVITNFTNTDGVCSPEVEFNLYGSRGVVDVVRYAPTVASGCRIDCVEVETRIGDLNDTIRKIKQRGEAFPAYLERFKDLRVGRVTCWLVLPPTQECAEVVLDHPRTFDAVFGLGTLQPQPEGPRYALAFLDPMTSRGMRAVALRRLLADGNLSAHLSDMCTYTDKHDFERALYRFKRSGQTLVAAL